LRLTGSSIEVHRADIEGLMLAPRVDTDACRDDTLYDELPTLPLSLKQLVTG